LKKYRQAKLSLWEVPRRDAGERRQRHPEVRAERPAARHRWKARKRAREAAMLAAERGDADSIILRRFGSVIGH
jgi:hypothetical protein